MPSKKELELGHPVYVWDASVTAWHTAAKLVKVCVRVFMCVWGGGKGRQQLCRPLYCAWWLYFAQYQSTHVCGTVVLGAWGSVSKVGALYTFWLSVDSTS